MWPEMMNCGEFFVCLSPTLWDRFFVVIPISQMGKLRFREIEHYTHYLTCLFPEVPTLCVVIISPLVWWCHCILILEGWAFFLHLGVYVLPSAVLGMPAIVRGWMNAGAQCCASGKRATLIWKSLSVSSQSLCSLCYPLKGCLRGWRLSLWTCTECAKRERSHLSYIGSSFRCIIHFHCSVFALLVRMNESTTRSW